MSLPNDDENGRQPWRDPFGPRDGAAISPIKKLPSDADDRTADETSIGSMSFTSDMTSVAAIAIATPIRHGRVSGALGYEAPLSTLSANSTSILASNSNDDNNSIQSGVSFNADANAEDAVAIQLRRGRNRRRLQRMGVATGATFALFVYMLIPTALLLSMILFGGVSSAFLYQLAEITRWEFYRSVLEGRGIGDYLPRGLYELLTATSLHDFLTDPDGIFGTSEHLPYLMLYLIPGLTPEQLDHYLNRLSPTHQGLLRNEQGLMGYFLNRNNHRVASGGVGNSDSDDSMLMRVIMGDERLREWRQQQASPQHYPSNIVPRRLELPPTIPEGSEDDAPISFSAPRRISIAPSSTEPEPPSAGIPATVAAIVSRAVAPNPAVEVVDSSLQQQPSPQNRSQATRPTPTNERESTDTVLYEAVGSAVGNFVGDATNTVRERARESFREVLAVPIYRVSLGATVLGLGVGILGLANGTYDLRSMGRLVSDTMGSMLGLAGGGRPSPGSGGSVPMLSMPSGGFLMGATIASGTTAVVLGIFGFRSVSGSGSESGSGSSFPGDTAPATKSNDTDTGEHPPSKPRAC